MSTQPARLIFEDGSVFIGKTFALSGDRYAELVFNTAMTGYQEILTDPSYCGQMVVMTYPLIGNYGINAADHEGNHIFLDALIVKEYIDFPSNWRAEKTLKTYLKEHNILGVEGMDTRAITRYLRERGTCKALLTTTNEETTALVNKLKHAHGITGFNLAQYTSCTRQYTWDTPEKAKYNVAVIDCGIKHNILRLLYTHGCACTVFPSNIHSATILQGEFDGVFLSNGPGDPDPLLHVIAMVKQLLGKLPFFGICLGHQMLGLAVNAKIFKLKFGNHGVNHPIKNLQTGKVEITSQNHNYALEAASMNEEEVEITHINLNNATVAGIRLKQVPAFSVQYHPEAMPGPHDSHYLFKQFTTMMDAHKKANG